MVRTITIFFIGNLLSLSCGISNSQQIALKSKNQDTLFVTTQSNDSFCISYLALRQGGAKKTLTKVYCMDGSSIDFLGNFKGEDRQERIGIYAIYNAAVDGSKFLFFDYLDRKAYITYAYFSDCRPDYTSLDFEHRCVVLRSIDSFPSESKDTLDIGKKQEYVICGKKYQFVKAGIKSIIY